MEDQGLSTSKRYFLIKLEEDIKILYKRFNFFLLCVLIYKFSIKIPGIFAKKKIFDKDLNNERNKLV